jgi:hypothetical protein
MFVFTVVSPFRLASVTSSRPCRVSNPSHVKRSGRISRITLSCLLHLKGYGPHHRSCLNILKPRECANYYKHAGYAAI